LIEEEDIPRNSCLLLGFLSLADSHCLESSEGKFSFNQYLYGPMGLVGCLKERVRLDELACFGLLSYARLVFSLKPRLNVRVATKSLIKNDGSIVGYANKGQEQLAPILTQEHIIMVHIAMESWLGSLLTT
jgi:hypothetical protein